MKKILLPALCVLSLTLFSFRTRGPVFEPQGNGNYLVTDGSTVTQEDADLLKRNTQVFDGSGLFKTIKIFKTKFIKGIVSETLTQQNSCDCPDDPAPTQPTQEIVRYLVAKYN